MSMQDIFNDCGLYACMDVPGMEMWNGQILKQD